MESEGIHFEVLATNGILTNLERTPVNATINWQKTESDVDSLVSTRFVDKPLLPRNQRGLG